MQILKAWHDLVLRHFYLINGLFLISSLLLAILFARTLQVSSDWTRLFRAQDPELQLYQELAAADANAGIFYVRLRRVPHGDAKESRVSDLAAEGCRLLSQLEEVETCFPLPTEGKDGSAVWLQVSLSSQAANNGAARRAALRAMEDLLDSTGSMDVGITGSEAVLRDFERSVRRDFIRSSVIALLLVSLLLFTAFRFSVSMLAGFGYQLGGLIWGVALFHVSYADLNMLSAALPCVLIGLGVDFVIHFECAGQAVRADNMVGAAGMQAYALIAKPMVLGAATTAAAFAVLAFTPLAGLRPVALLGCTGMAAMFAAVFLLMPPAITRFAAKARKGHPPALQLSASPVNRRRWAMGLTALLVVLAAGAPLARLENDIKRLYDPNMPSLLMLDELQAATGAYPNRLLARIDTAHPAATLERLNRPHTTFRWLAKANMQSRQDRAAEGTLYITLLPVRNPFDVRNFNAIRNELEQVAKESGASAVALSGDAALSLHLNRLLLRSMGAAAAAVMVILAVILFSLYRSWRETLGPLLVLTMALAGTVGLLAFTGNALSAYTLILLPLLIGIGIDDCFHVLHAARQSGRVETAPHVLAAVTLTTLTTLAGYGSLIAASNKGFVAMGITAISGLSLAWAGSLFILPQFIDLRHHKPPS